VLCLDNNQTDWIDIMNRFVLVSLVSLFATCTATTGALAGAAFVPVPEPSSLALLAGGIGIVYLAHKLRRRK
jgi:hypothetical protein